MVSTIVAKVLNRTLGAFVENLQTKQLNVSLFSGTAKLEDLSIKKDILDNLPLPFRLEFGYIGRIFVDIPIRNIGSAPVKAEVQNVYILLKLKDKSLWSKEAELKAFQDSKRNSLDTFEELQEGTRELKSKDPGYFSKLAAKIVDNLQMHIENIYIRIEDDISYPEKPCVFGITLKKIMGVTTDREWHTKFVAGSDEIYKFAAVKGLSTFFDYADRREELFVEHQVKTYNLKSFVEFAKHECEKGFEARHSYLLSPLNIELRAIINKEPKKSLKPQIQAHLKVGMSFDVATIPAGTKERLALGVDVKQISIGMKAMEFVGMYSKFQAEALAANQETKLTEEQKERYDEEYCAYINAMRQKNQKATDAKRAELEKLEEGFALNAIKKVRVANKIVMDFEEHQEELKKDTEKRVKEMQSIKSSALTSVGSFFGSSSSKEKQKKAREAVDKYREDLTKEQEEKLRKEREAIDKELKEIFSSAAEIDVTTSLDLPASYERFRFAIEISEISVSISQGADKLVELCISYVKLDAAIGKLTQKFAFAVESLDIFDFLSRNKAFHQLIESRCLNPKEVKRCISAQFISDPTNPTSDLTLTMDSNCQLIFYANAHTAFSLICLLQEAVLKENVELEYYKEFARAALSKLEEYIQLGIAFAKDAYSSTEQSKHFNINLLIKLAQPIIVVPCDPTSDSNSSALICDLGTVRARSVTHRKDPKVNYKELTDVSQLYDYYELRMETIQVYISEGDKEQSQHKYIRDLSLQIRLYDCLEPFHPSLPVMKIGGILNRVDMVLTDYNSVYVLKILDSIQREQMALEKKMAASKHAAEDKLIKEHGGVEQASMALSQIAEEKAKSEVKPTEAKVETSETVLSPDKKVREIMVHFDDVNIVFGRTLIKGREAYGMYPEGYIEELRAKSRGEVPFMPEIRAGINGVGLHAYMTFSGGVTVKSHVFRIYVKDVQQRKSGDCKPPYRTLEEKYGLKKVVASEFESIVHSPGVDALKDRLTGDNYAPFKENREFFERLEKGSYLEEQKNQVDIALEGNLAAKNIAVSLALNDMCINFPYDTLTPSLYLLSEFLAAIPVTSSQVTEEKRLSVILPQKGPKTAVSYLFAFNVQLKGIDLRLPINCETAQTKCYQIGFASKMEGELKTLMTNDDPSTEVNEMSLSWTLDKFAMTGFEGPDKPSWTIVSPMKATLAFKDKSSVPDDQRTTAVGISVQPLDATMRIDDTEQLLEFSRNLMLILTKYEPLILPKIGLGSVVDPKKAEESDSITIHNSSLLMKASLERISFTAINDKMEKEYPLIIAKLEGISADVVLGNKKGDMSGTKDISAMIKGLSCELGQSGDTESFVKFGMNSLGAKVKIDAEGDMSVTAGLKRLYLKDTQKSIIGEAEDQKQHPLLAKEFEYLICNPNFESKEQKFADADLGQFEIKMDRQSKSNSTKLSILFADFRVSLVLHTARTGIRYFNQLLSSTKNLKLQTERMLQEFFPSGSPKENVAAVSTKPSDKGKTQLLATVSNIEIWVPEDATKTETTVVKYIIKSHADIVNEIGENGASTLSIEGNVENMSIQFVRPHLDPEHILDEFDITLNYKEGISRDIVLDIKPIKVKITFQQLLLFQKLVDQITDELDSLEFSFAPDSETDIPSPAPSAISQALSTRLKLAAKLGSLNLMLEDDLDMQRYPLIKVWAVNFQATAAVDPKGDKKFAVHLFEVAIELGKSLDSDKEKYKNLRLPKPTATFKGDTEEAYPPYKELIGFRINGLEAEVNIDEKENVRADAKLWRLVAKDRQLGIEDSKEFRPLLAPDFQAILGNPKIEEACAAVEEVTDTGEKVRLIKERLGAKSLSQLHIVVVLQKQTSTSQNIDVDLLLEEFRVILAAPTVIALAKVLKHAGNVKDRVMPRIMLDRKKHRKKKAHSQPEVEPIFDIPVPEDISSRIIFRGKLRNIVVLLPETGKSELEPTARFSLTTSVEADIISKGKSESSAKLHVAVEEICLELLQNRAVTATLIPKTVITLDLSDETKDDEKLEYQQQSTKLSVMIETIKLHLAFRHLQFFAEVSAKILANLPRLEQRSSAASSPTGSVLSSSSISDAPLIMPEMMRALHKDTLAQGRLGTLELVIFDDSMPAIGKAVQYPCLRLVLNKASGEFGIIVEEERHKQRVDAGVEEVRVEVARQAGDFGKEEDFCGKDFLSEEVQAYMVVLRLGFEGVKATGVMNMDSGHSELEAHLHKLYMKDTHMKMREADHKPVPAVASDFQDILSNLSLAKSAGKSEHQLEIKLGVDPEEATVNFVYSDFRIIVAPPVILGLLEVLNLLLSQSDKILVLITAEQPRPSEPLPSPAKRRRPSTRPPVKSTLKFSGEVCNIEVWIPRNAELNSTQICQFSLSSKLNFTGIELNKGKALVQRNVTASVRITQLSLIMINKHLLPPGTSLSLATRSVILLPARMSAEFRRAESRTESSQSTKLTAFIEPITILIGFRDIAFFWSLAENYRTVIAELLKKPDVEPTVPVEEAAQIYGVDSYQIEAKVDPMQISLVDNTGAITQQLFRVLLSSMTARLSATNLLDETRREGIREEALKAGAKLAMEVMFYNNAVSAYEPIMEGWGVEANLYQKGADYGKELTVKADKMLNFNMSYAAAYAIAVAMKKMVESEEKWGKQQEMVKSEYAEAVEKLSLANIRTEGFIFENNIGYALTFYIQSMNGEKSAKEDYKKFQLKPQEIMFVPKDELKAMRIQQAKAHYMENMKIVSEDVLRIMVKVGQMKMSPGIPIELCRPHSFMLQDPDKKDPKRVSFPIVCRVKTINWHKRVVFESTVVLSNNTTHEVTFYGLEHNKAYSETSTATLKLSHGASAVLPFQWLAENRTLGIICMREEKSFGFRLIAGLKTVFKPCLESEAASKVKELLGRAVPFRQSGGEGEAVFLGCDIAAFSCHKISSTTPLQYLISLNAPLLVHNYLPRPLELSYRRKGAKEEDEKCIGLLKSQDAVECYTFDSNSLKESRMSWKIHISDSSHFICDAWDSDLPPSESFERQLHFLIHSKDKIESERQKDLQAKVAIRPNNDLCNDYDNFKLREKVFEHAYSKKLVISVRHAILNKTDIPLEFGVEGEFIIPLDAHSSCLFNIPAGTKLSFRARGFGWSKRMQVTTVGVTGAFSLQRTRTPSSAPEEEKASAGINTLDFGIKIEPGDAPFALTTVVTIVPRYIMVNKLPYPLMVCQYGSKTQELVLHPDQKICYNFERAEEESDKKIAIGDFGGGKEEQKMSRPFLIEDIDDFQVMYHSDFWHPSWTGWNEPNKENEFHRCVRISVTSKDDATLFICFQIPKFPEYSVNNSTKGGEVVTVYVKDTKTKLLTALPGQTVPMVWPDHIVPEKKINLFVGTSHRPYDITTMGELKPIIGDHGKSYRVRTITKNFGRQIIVTEGCPPKHKPKRTMKPEEKGEDEKQIEAVTHTKDDLKVHVSLPGFGASLVDSEPKELLYASLCEIALDLEKKVTLLGALQDTNYYLSADVGHIQVDNTLERSFPVIFGPHRLFVGDKKLRDSDWGPFVQFKASITESKEEDLAFTRVNSVQLQLGEMSAFVDLEVAMNVYGVVSSIQQNFFGKETINLKSAGAEDEKSGGDTKIVPIHEVFTSLEPSLPSEPPVSVIGENRVFIEFMHLAAAKINLTLRLKKVAVDPTGPLAILEVFYSVFATISNISDASVYFSEILLENAFTGPKALASLLQKKYTGRAIRQAHRLLGAIDIIGNPIGLIDQVGSGVFEFFNEPRKGIMKGPKEFTMGIGKGIRSLVTNVVGASLDSVSRVTGSLYSLVKNVSGEKVPDNALKKPDNIISGAWQGVKGGAIEVATGLSGIFTKPIKGARAEGAKGFFKGLGQGFIGAITSPVTAALKLGTSFTQGIERTVTMIGKGSVPQLGRVRYPRYITPANVMVSYNEELSEARLLLNTLERQKYAGENILLFELVHQKKDGKEPRYIVITEKRLLVMDGNKSVAMQATHTTIAYSQLFGEKDGRYVLQIVKKSGHKIAFAGLEYPTMSKCGAYFPKSKSAPDDD